MKGVFKYQIVVFNRSSFLRRFEQALIEGDVRFEEDQAYVFEMMRSFYDIEGLTERLRTCPQYEKKDLWINMKTLSNNLDNFFVSTCSFCEALI